MAGRDNQSQVYASIFTSDKLEVYFYTLMKKNPKVLLLAADLHFFSVRYDPVLFLPLPLFQL